MQLLDFKTNHIVDQSLQDGIDFIKNLKADIPCGKHEIKPGLFANVFELETKNGGNYEAHRKHIDIQAVLMGEELVNWGHRDDFEIHTPYQDADDYLLFHPNDQAAEALHLVPGRLMVLYPEDAHRPNQAYGQPGKVKKIVVKVPVAK